MPPLDPGVRGRATVGRHWHRRLQGHRPRVAKGSLAALLAVTGPGLLAGLSDDDPAGITTYSILGAKYGYQLLWVLTLSTAALVVFHEISARLGTVTGKGLMTLVRERRSVHATRTMVVALLVANLGTTCAEFAGIAAAGHLLGGVPRGVSVPVAALAVAALVLRGSFHRVEHVLLALSTVFVAYIAAGFVAGPDWGQAARGLVVPDIPLTRDAVLVAVATLGTTLARRSSSPTRSTRSSDPAICATNAST
ncbi:MAG: Nramp family divalent metal transporter [Solirubrobacteraceae bacterium]